MFLQSAVNYEIQVEKPQLGTHWGNDRKSKDDCHFDDKPCRPIHEGSSLYQQAW